MIVHSYTQQVPFEIVIYKHFGNMYIRGCQIGMQGPQFCTKPCLFCKLYVATSRMAFLDLNLHGLQLQIQTIEDAL